MSLGQRIREFRQTRGLTQSQLGGEELSKSFISLLEKDRAKPSLDTIVLLARRLDTSVDALLGQCGRLPEMIGEGLLCLAREAARRDDAPGRSGLMAAARFITAHFGLEDAARELALLDARIALEDRRFEEAWKLAEGVRLRSEEARDLWRAGRARVLLGWIKLRSGEMPAARPLLDDALLVLRRARAGRDPARIEALIALGTVLTSLGDHAGAIRRFEEAARSDVAQRTPSFRGRALWGIGLAHRTLGHLAVAGEYLLQAKDAFQAAEELTDLSGVLKHLGDLRLQQGQPRDALRYLHHALRVAERLNGRVTLAPTLTEIGRAHLVLGDAEEADAFARRALAAARETGDPVEVAEAQIILARVSLLRKNPQAAIRLYRQALGVFQTRAMRARIADVAQELGLLLRRRRAHAQAAGYLAMSLGAGEP